MKKGFTFLLILALLIQGTTVLAVVGVEKKKKAEKNVAWQQPLPAAVTAAVTKMPMQMEKMIKQVQEKEAAAAEAAPTAEPVIAEAPQDDRTETAPTEEQPDSQAVETQKEAAPVEPEEYSDFEDPIDIEKLPTQEKHGSLWTCGGMRNNPYTPEGLILIFKQRPKINSKYKVEFRDFVKGRIVDLTNALVENHKRRATEVTVDGKRNICEINREKTTLLMNILELAKKRELSVEKDVLNTALALIKDNEEAVKELAQTEATERNSYLVPQGLETINARFNLSTLNGQLKRFTKIKPASVTPKSKKRSNIIKQVTEMTHAYAELIRQQKTDPEALKKFLSLCKNNKTVPESQSMLILVDALRESRELNNEQITEAIKEHLEYDYMTEELSDLVYGIIDSNYITSESVMINKQHTATIDQLRKMRLEKQINDSIEEVGIESIFDN